MLKSFYYVNRKNIVLLVAVTLVFTLGIERFTLPDTTDDMQRRALEYTLQNNKELPPKPFVYDGCTFFVDSLLWNDFERACLMHDIAYWHGGTKEEKKTADTKLKEAIQDSGLLGNIVAYPAYVAVRMFGDSWLTKSVDAHWGFGWDE